MAALMFAGSFDWKLVALSIVIQFCASYITLELAERSVSSPLHRKNFWIVGGALSIGVGLWGANKLVLLSLGVTAILIKNVAAAPTSLIWAVVCSFIALLLVCWRPMQKAYLLAATVVLSGSMAALLYLAIQGLQLDTRPKDSLRLVALSLFLAAAACFGTARIGHHFQQQTGIRLWPKMLSGLVMAAAICSVQYIAMLTMNIKKLAIISKQTLQASDQMASETVIWVSLTLLAVFGLSVLISEASQVALAQRRVLRLEQERWRLLLETSQDGLFDFHLTSGDTFFSPRWKEMIGYTAGNLEDTLDTWRNRIHPDDRRGVDLAVEQYLRNRLGAAEMEYRLRHQDGSWRWVSARMQAVWSEEGEPVRLFGSHRDITDQKRTEAELAASHARFGAFMQHNRDLAFVKDGNGRFLYLNAALQQVWKLQPGEWIGQTNGEIWPSSVARQVTESDMDVLSTRGRSEQIEEFELPDGSAHQFLTSKFCFPDASGRVLLGGVSIDITERLKMQGLLRSSELRLQQMFDHNPVPAWTYRLRDLHMQSVNQAAIDFYGWPRPQFLNLTPESLLADAEGIEDAPQGAVLHRRNDRGDVWVDLTSHDFESAGEMHRLVLAQDVTGRTAYENAAQQEQLYLERQVTRRVAESQAGEARWRNLLEALPHIVWYARGDGYCEFINHHLSDYTGLPVDHLLGWGWRASVHPADRENLRTRWMAALAHGSEYEAEYRVRSKDGDYRWFMTRGHSIRLPDSAAGEQPVAPHWVGTTIDVEEQKRTHEHREAVVAESTLALSKALDQAQVASRGKSDFLAAVSQEVRTPLSGVLGMTSLIADTSLTSKQRSYVETMRSCVDALLQVINDVLDFSKIEAGKMQIEHQEFVLESVLEEAVDASAAAAAAKGIQLQISVADNVPFHVVGDAQRVRQVLVNLLSHAVKSSPVGAVSVSVTNEPAQTTDEISPGRIWLSFQVRDSGPGLTSEEQVTLFEPFVQAGAPADRRLSGTGLGLSIARQLVDLMGGTIGVHSRRGEGSTCWFRLPMSSGSALLPPEYRVEAGGHVLILTGQRNRLNGGAGQFSPPDVAKRYLERAGMKVHTLEWPGARPDEPATLLPVSLVVVDAALLRPGADAKDGLLLPGIAGQPLVVLGSSADASPALLSDGGIAQPREVAFVAKPVRCLPLLNAVRPLLSRGPETKIDSPRPRRQGLQQAEILLVEGNPINQLITKLFLVKLGCQVTLASNGLEACAAVEYKSFDLILMDCQMPVMDGFHATRTIREKERGHRTPIIALSAGVLKEERERCYAAGMDDVLSKPLEKKELESALQNSITKHARQAVG